MAIASLVFFIAVLGFVPAFVCFKLIERHDPREPPLAPEGVPFVGHLIGLITRKYEYFVDLSHLNLESNHSQLTTTTPIFTLPLPGQKFYVIKSPKLIQAVQRQYRTVSFGPVVTKFVSSLSGGRMSSEAYGIFCDNITMRGGDWGFGHDWERAIHDGMKLGVGLDGMNRMMIGEVVGALEGLRPGRGMKKEGGGRRKIMLNEWLRETLTAATTNSVYGERNPFRDPEVVEAFWNFEKRMIWFATGLANRFTVPRAIAGRDRLIEAFSEYYSKPTLEGTSAFTKARYEQYTKHSIPVQDIPCFEVPLSLGFLVNTIPASFWTLFHLFADPELLRDIRAEIDAVTRTENSKEPGGTAVRKLDITSLKQNCPLLLSFFQEILRYHSVGTSVREVVDDTLFEGRWLLRKGALVQIPSRVVHTDPVIWGSDVLEFKSRRFMKGNNSREVKGGAGTGRRRGGGGDTCFRAFGGGKQLCPGRHFATNEVLALAAVLVARFDLRPINAGGEWVRPTTRKTNAAAQLMEPDWDLEVEVCGREGVEEDAIWEVSLRDSGMGFAMVAEDLGGGDDEAEEEEVVAL